MTGLEEQIKKLNVAEAKNSFCKNPIADDLQKVRLAGENSVAAVERLVNVIQRRFNALITKADFRKGVSTESRLETSEKVEHSEAENKIEQWIDPQLIECQCCSRPTPTIVEFENDGHRQIVVSVPLFSRELDNVDGAIATLLESPQNPESVAAEMEALALGLGGVQPTASTQNTDDALQTLKKIGSIQSVRELGFLLSNQLAAKYDCEQVAFGHSKNNRSEVVAISGVTSFKSNSPGVISIQQAMNECVDHRSPVVYQLRGELELENGFRIHQQWSRASGDASVCSIPLFSKDKVVAVVSFRRTDGRPFSQRELDEIQGRIAGFGPAVELIQNANASAVQLVRKAIVDTTRQVVNPRTWMGKIALTAFAILMAYMLFGSTVYRPRCVANLSPGESTHFSAPFDTVLQSVHVNAGDEVKKGQLLFVMDTRELESSLAATLSQLEANNVEMKNAITNDQIAKAAQHRKLGSALRAQASSLQRKIQRSKVLAPEDGIITSCELTSRVGQAFRIGDEMLTFARKDDWQVEVRVPDHVASYVRKEQSVTFASTTRPGETFEFNIGQFEKDSQVKDGRNVFIAKGRLAESKPWMRSGMEGFARIKTEKKPVWWVTFHRVIDLARIHFWF